jgi:hypothetical protein
MIQIAAQVRILVALEAIDGRKGIDAGGPPVQNQRRRCGCIRLSCCSRLAIRRRKPRRLGVP